LLVIACTLPATSTGCERWFKKLKLIKTYLRNGIDVGRLSNLGIISLNAERATVLSLDSVVDSFAQMNNNSRLTLV
jgi:hypothetical protein